MNWERGAMRRIVLVIGKGETRKLTVAEVARHRPLVPLVMAGWKQEEQVTCWKLTVSF